ADGRAAERRRLDVGDVHDSRRALAERGYPRRPGFGLALPGVVLGVARARPGAEAPRDPGPRQERRADGVVPLAEGEHVQALGPCLQRVAVLAGEVDEAVAWTDRERLRLPRPLQGDAAPAEHVEDLLLRALEVQGRRPAAGLDLDALEADPDRRAAGEVPPASRDVTPLATHRLDLVPVGEHPPILSQPGPRPRPRGRTATGSRVNGVVGERRA